MQIVRALFALALAYATSVAAVCTNTTCPSQATTFSLASGTATGTYFITGGVTSNTLTVTQPAQHSVYSYTTLTGATASAPYTWTYSGNMTNATTTATTISSSNSAVVIAVSNLTCTVCNAAVSTSAAYNWISTPATNYVATNNAVTANTTVVTDVDILLANATARSMQAATVDTTNLRQPGKLFYFVTNSTATVSNIYNATLTFTTTTSNPFTYISLVGGAKCPVYNSTDGVTRFLSNITTNTTISGSIAYTNLAAGTFWVYFAPTNAIAAGTAANALGSSDTVTLNLVNNATGNCSVAANGFCSSAATVKSAVGVAFAGVMAAAFMLF